MPHSGKPQVFTVEDYEVRSQGYTLRRDKPLGEGAHGHVYMAVDIEHNSWVAIKSINAERLSPAHKTKMRKEVEVMRRLEHPNIVKLIEAFETHDRLYLVLELARTDLFHFVTKYQGLSEDHARYFIKAITEAVQHLHNNGIAHRDLKCANVLLDALYTPKLADFGLSKQLLNVETGLCNTFVGTLEYMPPEVFAAKYNIQGYNGYQMDVWSLGVILFFMVQYTFPFDFSKERTEVCIQKMKAQHFHYHPAKGMTKAFYDLIVTILEPNVQKRYRLDDFAKDEWVLNTHHRDSPLIFGYQKENIKRCNGLPGATCQPGMAGQRFVQPGMRYQGDVNDPIYHQNNVGIQGGLEQQRHYQTDYQKGEKQPKYRQGNVGLQGGMEQPRYRQPNKRHEGVRQQRDVQEYVRYEGIVEQPMHRQDNTGYQGEMPQGEYRQEKDGYQIVETGGIDRQNSIGYQAEMQQPRLMQENNRYFLPMTERTDGTDTRCD